MQKLSVDYTVVCDLTPMTGQKASSERRVPIPGIGTDVPFRYMVVFLGALLPSAFVAIIVGLALSSFLGGLLTIPVVEGFAFFLFERRTRDGLRLRTYQALMDERKQKTAVLTLCGVEVDPFGATPLLVQTSSVTLPRDDRASIAELLDMYDPQADHSRPKPGKKSKVGKQDQRDLDAIFGPVVSARS